MSKRIFLIATVIGAVLFSFMLSGSDAMAAREPVYLVIDTDTGVDDAAALGWLLSQDRYRYELLGITTVAGNTTVDNATNNVLTVLDAAGRADIPVVKGAAAPLNQPLSSMGKLIHGPFGFWYGGLPHDQSGLRTDAPAFLCEQAVAMPGAKLVTLGPVTNLAQAINQCPADLANYSEIIMMGGSKTLKTPRGDYNMWQDTMAADIVLKSGLPLTFMTVEASEQIGINAEAVGELQASSNPIAQTLAGPLSFYYGLVSQQGGEDFAPLYDVAAVQYAVRPQFAKEAEYALVKIVMDPGLAFGQTIIGNDLDEVIPLVADDAELSALADAVFADPFNPDFELFEMGLGGIFLREPFNANVILDVRKNNMNSRFLDELE
ncbi:MAG: nucleoside hydrolase [Anaerolineales bacterium]|nr:nucleoside hydrolase [Anaerolineales bacterium]